MESLSRSAAISGALFAEFPHSPAIISGAVPAAISGAPLLSFPVQEKCFLGSNNSPVQRR
jgi:hypothetical protein